MNSDNYESQASTDYKEAFSLFDKRGSGRVPLDSLGDLLRACGQNPTLSEIRDLEKNVGGECRFPPCSVPSFPPAALRARTATRRANSGAQSTSRPSSACSTAPAASASRASRTSTVADSRCLIKI